MKKCAYIYINYPNIVVLKDYLDVIKTALEQCGYDCEYVKSLEGISKKALIVFPMANTAFGYYLKGYRNIVLWQQGTTGAESFMRHQSKIRKSLLDFMDCFVMKKAKMILYVSDYMKKYYEKMAHRNFTEKAYIMPCFNEVLPDGVFEKKDYSQKIFAYVGSLSEWQCFNETADIYAELEKQIPDAFFKVLTFKTEEAERILKEKNIKNYSVACVPKEEVKKELEEVSYGFIVRQDIDVNRVATPTKISSYLASGVLPLYSSCLTDFHARAKGKTLAFAVNIGDDLNALVDYVKKDKDKNVIKKETEDLFNTYYSTEKHMKNIALLAEKRLGK